MAERRYSETFVLARAREAYERGSAGFEFMAERSAEAEVAVVADKALVF